jgi:transcription elongation factor GreA
MRRIKEKYERELAELRRELTIDLPKEIQRAVALGDLRENAEYSAALERQSYVQARMAQVAQRLQQLATLRIDQVPRGRVGLGSLATVRDLNSGDEIVYDLVLPDEGEGNPGAISVSSPIGRALMGKEIGDQVAVQTPGGTRDFEIIDLVTVHDRDDDGVTK